MPEKPIIVLFLCTGNIARSQMAEAFLRRIGGENFEVHSAGLTPGEAIHPFTLQVMAEIGYDLAGQEPKQLKTYFGKLIADYVIFVCAGAETDCPYLWPSALHGLSWPFDDPTSFSGADEDRLQKFRAVRDQIEAKVRAWVDHLAKPQEEGS